MDSKSAPSASRIKAAEVLLDRGIGKAVQSIELGLPGDFDRLTEAEIRSKLKDLREEQAGDKRAPPLPINGGELKPVGDDD